MVGVLRGFDPFMNLVLDETVEEVSANEKHNIGMVVSKQAFTVVQFLTFQDSHLTCHLQLVQLQVLVVLPKFLTQS